MGWWTNYHKKMKGKDWLVNLLLYLSGIVLMPLGVVLTVNSHLGAGGYDALNFALGAKLQINTSYAIYMTAGIAVLLAAAIRKKLPRLTTFISSFFLGIFTDIWKNVLEGVEGSSWTGRIFLFAVGLVIIAFAVAAYILCIFPSNPTDDLVAAMQERGVRIGVAKVGLDVVCVIIAFLLKGEIGVGTIVCTLALGPMVDLFFGGLRKVASKYNIFVEI